METLVFDLESGPRPEAELKAVYREKSYDEFAASCDARWKDETRKAKYDEYKATSYAEFMARAALSPLTGRVLALGFQKCDKVVILDNADEAEILAAFWTIFRKYQTNGGRMIGWNSNGFDVPFLVRRSWYLGVAVPAGLLDKNGRYLCGTFVDLMQLWACGGRDYEKLDTAARFLGLGGKPEGVDGSHFATLFLSGDPASRQAALDYLTNDLAMTWKLAERMGAID